MTTSTLHLRGISLWGESEISSTPNRTERETP